MLRKVQDIILHSKSQLVYGIEASKIGDHAELVIKSQKLDKYIEIVKNRIENLKPTDLPKVDILVSECMGYALLYVREIIWKSLIWLGIYVWRSVRSSRQVSQTCMWNVIVLKYWSNKDGVVFPNEAKIYVAPITDEDYYESKVSYWKNVYGMKYYM